MQIVCGNCFIINRVPEDRLSEHPRCGKCRHPLLDGQPTELNETHFDTFIQKNDLPVIVDFWADWCGPCKMMAPAFAKSASRQALSARFAKVNTEQSPKLAQRFSIRSIPTLVLFQSGREVDRISGALNETQIQRWLSAH